ncbi:3-methylcrotonyl-CoA carboxylase beta subunit isoform 1 [Dorcoceras hygrometricum]|uniref:3-methylcrotonyl-CoA carboxylase beta subunit isoform 1 n=1 Tax=Dorcoceras hygrometricum TaxID=472368 RepID=A0A2Z7D885_9LAMI|nr:3-methylcrotonyl-CoA carboxylase beta subunit isoform 1 [Dorcoceras hygrometricum]
MHCSPAVVTVACDWFCLQLVTVACDCFCLRLVTVACDCFCLRLVTVACDWFFLLATESFPLKYFTADLYPSSSFLLPADLLTQRLVVLEPTTG